MGDKMRISLLVLLQAVAIIGCGPNNFEFEQTAVKSTEPCSEGCTTDEETENILYEYTEVVPDTRSVDILFVDDNSGSMKEEQAAMGTKFPTFLAGLTGIDWQIGITTTDVSGTGEKGDLLTFEGSTLKVINATTPNYSTKFNETIQIEYEGDGAERGICAANMAVTKNYNSWMRTNSHLAIVVLSDEDENSQGQDLQDCDLPTILQSNVKAKLGTNKSVSFHSIIARPNDAVCLTKNGKFTGNTYAAATALLGGALGDICSSDYGVPLAAIAQSIQNAFETITLKCTPIGGTVGVTYNPVPAGAVTTTVTNDVIRFNPPLAAGTKVGLKYYCKP
jgi:hypothetical protein